MEKQEQKSGLKNIENRYRQLTEEDNIILQRHFRGEYIKLLKSKDIGALQSAIMDMMALILSLKQMKRKSFEEKTMIKVLSYNCDCLTKRVKYFTQQQYISARKRDFERAESETVKSLVKIISDNGFQPKRDHHKQPISKFDGPKEYNVLNIKGENVPPIEQIKVAIQTAIDRGVDPNDLNHQAVIDAGFGDQLIDYKIPIIINDDSDNDTEDSLESLQRIQNQN